MSGERRLLPEVVILFCRVQATMVAEHRSQFIMRSKLEHFFLDILMRNMVKGLTSLALIINNKLIQFYFVESARSVVDTSFLGQFSINYNVNKGLSNEGGSVYSNPVVTR